MAIIYLPDDITNPQGKNNLGTLGGFYQRSLYKDEVYPDIAPSAMDTWHDKFLYGRIDRTQNTVVPSPLNLISIPSKGGGDNMMALNVVVAAFEKLAFHMQKAAFMSVVNKLGNEAMLELRASRAYEAPGIKYAYFTQDLFNTFAQNLSGKQKFQIQDFSSFLKFYRRYLLDAAAVIPVTRTNYYLTSHASLFSTGISIAIANDDASDDSVKYANFIADPNFKFFRTCAKKFGFMLNKNAPWILTADLFSTAFGETAMGNYVNSAGHRIDKHNFFSTFYDPTHLTDFDDLIRILVNSYEQLLRQNPFYDKEVGALNDRCSISAKNRKPLGVAATEIINGAVDPALLPDKFLIDLYIDLRQAEVESPLSPLRLRTLKQEAYERYRSMGAGTTSNLRRKAVARYVNSTYKQYIYSKGAVDMQNLNRNLV